LNRAQQYGLATQDAEAALKLDPNCDVALAAKGETLTATGDDWAALPHAKRAAELNPRNALAWYLSGEIDAKHHSFATAAEALTKVIELQPSDHDALELREKCYRELGRTADADADAARRKTLEKK
jgi:tetratricopeptide (TPR) repeat protein